MNKKGGIKSKDKRTWRADLQTWRASHIFLGGKEKKRLLAPNWRSIENTCCLEKKKWCRDESNDVVEE